MASTPRDRAFSFRLIDFWKSKLFGNPWYARERRPLLKVLLEFRGHGIEMKFVHMYKCFSCNLKNATCQRHGSSNRKDEWWRCRGIARTAWQTSSSTSRGKDTPKKEKNFGRESAGDCLGVPRTFNRKLVCIPISPAYSLCASTQGPKPSEPHYPRSIV